jgi:hypothetical protein
VKGAKGVGARRGRRGWGAESGEISGRKPSTLLSVDNGPPKSLNGLQWHSFRPIAERLAHCDENSRNQDFM